GISANLINVAVFFKMDLSDNLTQNVFLLSVFDGVMSAANFVSALSSILLNTAYNRRGRTAETLQDIIWTSLIPWPIIQSFSGIPTLVIATVRCCCVAMPLKVKQVLSTRRQFYAIFVFPLF
ncbi:hypothetical protein EGW08_013113, partial [Elysia chlorotica]